MTVGRAKLVIEPAKDPASDIAAAGMSRRSGSLSIVVPPLKVVTVGATRVRERPVASSKPPPPP